MPFFSFFDAFSVRRHFVIYVVHAEVLLPPQMHPVFMDLCVCFRAVVSNSICLGAAGSSSWVPPGCTEPFAKGNVN